MSRAGRSRSSRWWRALRTRACCAPAPPSSPGGGDEQPRGRLGVLFVHGMGTHAQGATLSQFGEPLVDWLASGTARFDRAELTDVALTPGDDEPAHMTCDLYPDRDRTQPLSTWMLAESCWSGSFTPASYARIATWLIGSVPWMLGEYLQSALRRERRRRTHRLLLTRLVLSPLYAIAGVVLAGPLIVLLTLLLATRLLFPLPAVKRIIDKLPRLLSESLGDVYVILATHVDRESIRARIVRDHEWLKARCDRTVIVAHSAGSALTHQLIRDGRITGLEAYVTLGEAIWRMRWMRRLSERVAVRALALSLALAGFAAMAVAAVAWTASWGPTLSWGSIALVVVFHASSVWLVWRFARATEERSDAVDMLVGWPPKVPLWRDYVASSDPVPAGALTDEPRATALIASPVSQSPGMQRYQPTGIRNKRSIVLDHTSYHQNLEEFVAGLGADLVRADAALGDVPLLAPHTMQRAKVARALRTLSASMASLGSVTVGATLMFALARGDQRGLGRLGTRAEWAAEALDTALRKTIKLDLSTPTATKLVGVAIALILIVAASLLARAGWSIWDRADRRRFMQRRRPVATSRRPPVELRDEGTVSMPRWIDAAFAAGWLVCLAGVSLLVLQLAGLRWDVWRDEIAIAAGFGLIAILFVKTIATWRDNAYSASAQRP